MARQTFGSYLKAAFTNRWNVLALVAASAAAVISGHADVLLPLVAAGEVAFLGMISTNPRFHRAVDALQGAQEAAQGARDMAQRFDQLYDGLPKEERSRFDELRERCESLLDSTVRSAGAPGLDQVAQQQVGGVNRLLWVYLKLLHTKTTLERFFESIDPAELEKLEREAKRKLEEVAKSDGDALAEKKKKSLEDTLATVQARRANIKRAKENHEYVALELARIAAKLSGIAELAVNRQDPGMITHDVDEVAQSVQATEQAIGDLQMFTGLTAEDVTAPEILAASRQRVSG